MKNKARIAMWAGMALTLTGCLHTPPAETTDVNAEELLSAPQPFDGSPLPGAVPETASALSTHWYNHNVELNAELLEGQQPRLDSSIHLLLRDDGDYELVYHAQWGTSRNVTDPGYRGVHVRESGTYSLSGETLVLDPRTTEFTQLSGGNRNTQTITDERRSYVVHLDEHQLHIAGRCASYQVDPVCKKAERVRFPMRLAGSSVEWPDDIG